MFNWHKMCTRDEIRAEITKQKILIAKEVKAHDYEKAFSAEVKLMANVLGWIAEYQSCNCCMAQLLAHEALGTRDIDFPRHTG